MPDIEMRFHKDVLVLSAPPDETLVRYHADPALDREFFNLLEPETLLEILKLEDMAGAQCLVTCTDGITRARLAHQRLEGQSAEIAQASLALMAELTPQHVIAQIGPTNLPLDPGSRTSLKQSRDQYAQAARDFGEEGYDTLLLDSMTGLADLKCALEGVRSVTDRPLMAAVPVDAAGRVNGRDEDFLEAIAAMDELGADVVGLTLAVPADAAAALVAQAANATDKPLLVQLAVGEHDARDVNPGFRPVVLTPDNPYKTPDAVFDAVPPLVRAGAQFLRAVGQATASYTGALAIASNGMDAIR